MLDLLPREIIIEILSYLSRRRLIALTETSTLFNEIISETSSLSRKLQLQFVVEHKDLKWTGSRKYSRVYLEGSVANFYREIFVEISENLREIYLICLDMEASVLKQILINSVNLKKILIKDNKIVYKSEDFEEPLPKLNFQTVNYRNFKFQPTEIFKIFANCQVQDLKIVGFSTVCEPLKKFIKNQRNLQAFALHDIKKCSTIFAGETLNFVDFNLKKLILDKYSNNCDGLEKFLQNHRESLQHVELNEVQQGVLKILKKFPVLKRLEIFDMTFDKKAQTVMTTIEDLTIGYEINGRWAENFPNVRHLKIKWFRLKNDIVQIEELKKLEKLDLEFCWVPELCIPNVKSLRLSDVGFSRLRPFKYENNQIEELTLEHSSHGEWLIEYLKFYSEKLKVLTIREMGLSPECKKVIADCSKNFVLKHYRCKHC